MPYELKKVKNGYYVVSVDTGKKHSKKPLTKAKAEAQLRILLQDLPKEQPNVLQVYDVVRKVKQDKKLESLKEPDNQEEYLRVQRRHQSINHILDNPEFMEQVKLADPLAYHKLLNMPDEDIEGGGLFDFLKSAGNKVKNIATNIGQRISGAITGRDNYPPAERSLIEKYANCKIKKICIYREPLAKGVNMLTNALSAGQMGGLQKKYGYDQMFHLYMVITVEVDKDNYAPILIEKNEVINIHEFPNINPNAEKMELMISPKFNYTFKQFLDNGQRVMGSRYFVYDPFDNNCQVFISSLISANPPLEQDNPNANKFILQDVQGLKTDLNPVSRNIFRGATNLASRMNVLLKGYGFI
jgi:hypothetical protein